jgi:hypothetical protein
VLSLASVGLLGLLLLGGSLEPRRPLAQGNLAAAAVGPAPPVAVAADPAAGARSVAQLRRAGWAAPERLPGGLVLVRAETAHDAAGAPVVQLTYTDGAHTVVLSQQRGRLDTTEQAGFAPTTVGGSRVYVRGGEPWQVAWQSGGLVLTVTADAPWPLVEAAVAALPHHSPDNDWIDRVTRGATAVTAVLSRP